MQIRPRQGGRPVIAPASTADPRDRLDVVVDQDAEPADLERFLDALDRIVERRLSQRTEASNEAT